MGGISTFALTEDEMDEIRECVDCIEGSVDYRFKISKTDLTRRPKALRKAVEMMAVIYSSIINQGGFDSPTFVASEHIGHKTQIGQYEIWLSGAAGDAIGRLNIYVEKTRRRDGRDPYGQIQDLRGFSVYSGKVGIRSDSAPMECRLALTNKAMGHIRSLLPGEIQAWLMMADHDI
jgi:hypothetical protein